MIFSAFIIFTQHFKSQFFINQIYDYWTELIIDLLLKFYSAIATK